MTRLNDPVQRIAHARNRGPDQHLRVRAPRRDDLPGDRILCIAGVARTHRRAVAAPRGVEHLRVCRVICVGAASNREEVRLLVELIGLRRHMCEPHPVIQGQVFGHFPVVLDVTLDVVIEEAAFDVRRLLQVLIEDPQDRVRETEPAVEGVEAVIAEAHVALPVQVRDTAGARVLRLPTVVEVEPAFDGVLPPDLR